MEQFLVHLLVSTYKTSVPYLRNLKRIQLLGDFGCFLPSEKNTSKLYIQDTKNKKKVGPIFLRFNNMRNTVVGTSKFPQILKEEWSHEQEIAFRLKEFENSTFVDSAFLTDIRGPEQHCLKIFDFQLEFDHVASFLRTLERPTL